MRSLLIYFITLIIFTSCGMRRQNVKQIITYTYQEKYSNNEEFLSKIDLKIYKRETLWKDDMLFNKTLHLYQDSVINGISINYKPVYSFGHEHFYFMYKPPLENEKESFALEFISYNDSITKLTELESKEKNDDKKNTEYFLKTSYFSDSLNFHKTIQLNNKALEVFRNYASDNIDSLQFLDFPPISEAEKHSRLIKSNYSSIKTVSKDQNIYRSIKTDSSFTNGELKVKQKSQDYFYFEEVNKEGISTIIQYTLPQIDYRERRYQKNDIHPIYELQYKLDTITKDTIYRLEMNYTENKNGILYSYKVFNTIDNEKDKIGFGIPIIRKEITVLTDIKGSVINFHAIAYTNKSHKLEYAYKITPSKKNSNKREELIDNRTIPEISGSQKYNIEEISGYHFDWGYSDQKLNEKRIQKIKSEYNAPKRPSWPLEPEFRRKSKRLEKDRENNFEKRESHKLHYKKLIHHIWYFEDE